MGIVHAGEHQLGVDGLVLVQGQSTGVVEGMAWSWLRW